MARRTRFLGKGTAQVKVDDQVALYKDNTSAGPTSFSTVEGPCAFVATGAFKIADINSTPHSILADGNVPTGMKCYITHIALAETAAAAAAGGTSLKIQDTNGTAVDFFTFAGTIGTTLPSGFFITETWTAGTTTREDAFRKMTGGTASKGLQFKAAGTFSGNCALKYRIEGYFAP